MNYNDDIIHDLKSLYNESGYNKFYWNQILNKINNSDGDCQKVFNYMKQLINIQPNNILNLDLIDFIINYGNLNVISFFSQNEFLMTIINLLKNKHKTSKLIQKEIIFLIQKWYYKFINNKDLLSFTKCYLYLLKKRIVFPNKDYILKTYSKYILDEEIEIKYYKNLLKEDLNYIEEFEKIENKYSDDIQQKTILNHKNNEINSYEKNNYFNINEHITNYQPNNKNNEFGNFSNHLNNMEINYKNLFGNNIKKNY